MLTFTTMNRGHCCSHSEIGFKEHASPKSHSDCFDYSQLPVILHV